MSLTQFFLVLCQIKFGAIVQYYLHDGRVIMYVGIHVQVRAVKSSLCMHEMR